MKEKIWTVCAKCDYGWFTASKKKLVTCPSCCGKTAAGCTDQGPATGGG